MSRNPEFLQLLEKIKETHEKKSHDYAQDTNVFSNFEFAGQIQALFNNPTDKSFAVLIGVKLARLGELIGKGKEARNESIEDTFLDLACYAAIWGSMHMKSAALANVPDKPIHSPGQLIPVDTLSCRYCNHYKDSHTKIGCGTQAHPYMYSRCKATLCTCTNFMF